MFQSSQVGLKSFLVEFILRQHLLGLLVTKDDTVTTMQPIKKLVQFGALLDIGKQESLEERVSWRIAQLYGAPFRDEADLAPIVSMDVCHMLAVPFHCRLPQRRNQLFRVMHAIVVVAPAHLSSFALGGQSRDGLAKGESFIVVESEPLGDDTRP